MKNLKLKPFALLIFAVFAISFFFLARKGGQPVSDIWTTVTLAYQTIPLVLGAIGLFVLYGWRLRIFRRWLVPFPDLNGTWQGTIVTTWKDPQTGKALDPIPVILTIKQTFTRISCVMRTAEMTSRSYLADFWIDSDEQIKKFAYSYHSAPLPSVSHRSAPHEGTIVFEVIDASPKKLNGIYWTARQTTGEVYLTFRELKLLQEFPNDIMALP